MENNLDNFFKKKLHQREFEMEDANWAQMEQMIEADEKDNHKGFLWKWLLGALLLVAVVGGLWWSSKSVIQESVSNQTFSSKEIVETENSTIEITEEKNNTVKSEVPEKNNNTNTIDNKLSNDSENIDENSLIVNKTTQNKPSKSVSPKQPITTSKEPTVSRVPIESTVPNSLPSLTLPAANIKSDIEINRVEKIDLPLKNKEKESSEKTNDTNKKEIVKPIASTLLELPFLETNISSPNSLYRKDRIRYLPKLNWSDIKKNKWSFGITAGIVSFKDNQTNSILGAKLGLTAKYQFRKKLALNGDLMYFYRGGTYQPVDTTVHQTGYSFGRIDYQKKIIPENVHYFELPIYLTYPINRHLFEAGISASYLVGVRGATQRIQDEGLTEKISDSDWVGKTGFESIVVNILLGYRYQINSKLHFGLRAIYSPLGYNNLVEQENAFGGSLADRRIVQDIRPLHLNFKLTQYF